MDRWEALNKVSLNGLELANLDEGLRSDPEIVLRAVWQDGAALECAASELRTDKRFALKAVRQNGLALQHLPAELRADREVVWEAVSKVGFALRWASPELQADYEVVERAIRRDGFALRYAAEQLRQDETIALAAVLQNRLALGYVPEDLQASCLAELREREAPSTPPTRAAAAAEAPKSGPAACREAGAWALEAAQTTPPPGQGAASMSLVTPPKLTPPAPMRVHQRREVAWSEGVPSLESMLEGSCGAAGPAAEKREPGGAAPAGASPRKRPRWAQPLVLPPPWPLSAEAQGGEASR